MTTTLILVRHAAHELIDRVLVGRRFDVTLSGRGVAQSERLAAQLLRRDVAHILSSPRFRALQTARPLARAIGKPIEIAREFDEIDFGDWTGRSFEELEGSQRWRRWNLQRENSRPPHGESMRELQSRVLRGLGRVAAAYPGQCVAIVSHAEPVRAAILHYRGMALGGFAGIKVDPASSTTILVDGDHGVLAGENETADAAVAAA